MDKELLTLALVNHALVHGVDAETAWSKASVLAERGGPVRELATELLESVPLSTWV